MKTDLNNESTEIKKSNKYSIVTTLIIMGITLVFCTLIVTLSNKYLFTDSIEKRYEGQILHDKKLVNKKPNDPALRVQLGYSYFLNGEESEAIKQYKKAIELDENYFPAYFNLSALYDTLDKNEETLKYATKSLALAPKDANSALLKGRAYRKMGRLDKAKEALEKALEIDNKNTDVLYETALVAEKLKDYEDAKALFEETLSFNPSYIPAIEGLARLKEKTK